MGNNNSQLSFHIRPTIHSFSRRFFWSWILLVVDSSGRSFFELFGLQVVWSCGHPSSSRLFFWLFGCTFFWSSILLVVFYSSMSFFIRPFRGRLVSTVWSYILLVVYSSIRLFFVVSTSSGSPRRLFFWSSVLPLRLFLWSSGRSFLRPFSSSSGRIFFWLSGRLFVYHRFVWSPRRIFFWSSILLVIWSSGLHVVWSPRRLVSTSSGLIFFWLSGRLFFWLSGRLFSSVHRILLCHLGRLVSTSSSLLVVYSSGRLVLFWLSGSPFFCSIHSSGLHVVWSPRRLFFWSSVLLVV